MKKVIILGAAGRDFHNFNVYFRDNPEYKAIAFTATQIPFIDNRLYPSRLAGSLYPDGIPIYPEDKLEELIREHGIDEVVFAYSDVDYNHVMHIASLAVANDASFRLLSIKDTQLISNKKVIAITASRTGSGKSTLTRLIANIAKRYFKIAIIRHPMPYLAFDPIQHFKSVDDLDNYNISIEEEEEYIMHLRDNNEVYAGVDYELILREAEKEHDLIIWDGGNNDYPFIKPDLHITILDPLRADDAINYYPSEVNIRLADAIVINKVNNASKDAIDKCIRISKELNPKAKVFKIASYPKLDNPDLIKGKKVTIVEDSPSITHGEVKDSIALRLAREYGAEVVDASKYAKGSIKQLCDKYNIRYSLPSAGYSKEQLKDLEDSINGIDCEAIILATPADLARRIRIDKPIARLVFELADYDYRSFVEYIREYLKRL